MVLARDIDPTELGDALSQILKLPSRFVIGAVAGVRMMTLFQSDWQSLEMARRARGLTDVGKLQHLLTMSFGLLVIALRRGGKLATAMEARGFGRTPPGGGKRSWARESRLRARDGVDHGTRYCPRFRTGGSFGTHWGLEILRPINRESSD